MSATALTDNVEIGQGLRVAEPRPFFSRIESLRGIGALAVAGYHFSGWSIHGVTFLPDRPWQGLRSLQDAAGWLALHLMPGHAPLMMFFVISGFVLRVSLQYGPQEPTAAAIRFFLARIFRIYPIVVFGTLVGALANGWQVPASELGPAMPLDASLLVKNFLLLDVSMNPPLWALQIEVLMAPILVLLYFAERAYGNRAIMAFAVLATVLSFTKSWALWGPLSHNLFAFALGIVIPTVGRDLAARSSHRLASWLMVGAVALLFLPTPLLGFYSQFTTVIEAYAAVVLLTLVTYRPDIRGCGWLDSWPVHQLGRSSASYYVLHMATFPLGIAIAAAVIPAAWSLNAPAAVGSLVVAIWIVAIAPFGLVSYHAIEATGIALGRVVIGRWFKRVAPQNP